MSKLVKHEIDLVDPPALTDAQKAELAALEAAPDERIDYSDIPPTPERFWASVRRNPYYRPVKQQLTLRLDADLVAWFKQNAPSDRGYQTRINQALREYVEAHQGDGG